MADSIEVPIKLPTDSSGVEKAADAVKGLQDSLKGLGDAAAAGAAKAAGAVKGIGDAAAGAQKRVGGPAGRDDKGRFLPDPELAAQRAAEKARKDAERAAAAAAKAAVKEVEAERKAADAAEKARIKEREAAEKAAARAATQAVKEKAKAEKAAAREVEKARRDAESKAAARRQNNAATLTPAVMAAQEAAAAAAAVIKALVDMAVAFSTAVIRANVFKEATLGAFTALLGSSKAANKAFKDTIKTADQIGMSYEDALRGVNSLIAKGFKADQAQELVKAMADLKSVVPDANIGNLLLAITQIKSKGVLQMEELQGQIAEAGLSVSVVLEEIGKKIGKSAAEVRKMISAGKISADEGVQGILAAIQKTTGKPIGKAAEEASKSLGGLINRLQQVPQGLLLMAESGTAMDRVKNVLSNFLAAFAPGTKGGDALSASIGRLVEAMSKLLGPLEGEEGKATFEKLADGISKGIDGITRAILAVQPHIPTFTKGLMVLGIVAGIAFAPLILPGALIVGAVGLIIFILGKLVDGVTYVYESIRDADISGAVSDVVTRLDTAISDAAARVKTSAMSIGTNLVNGIIAGITSGSPALALAVAALGPSTAAAGQKGFQIKSPSKLMAREVGQYIPPGIAQGADNATPALDRSMAGLASGAAGAASGAIGGAPSGGGGGVTFAPVFNGPVYGAEHLRDLLDSWARDFFGGYALSGRTT